MSPTSNCPGSFWKLLQRFVTSKEPNKLRDTGTPYVDGQIHPQFINTSQKQTLPYLITIQYKYLIVFAQISQHSQDLFYLFFRTSLPLRNVGRFLKRTFDGRFKRSQSHNSPPASWAKSGSKNPTCPKKCTVWSWGKMIPIFNTSGYTWPINWSYNMFVFYW